MLARDPAAKRMFSARKRSATKRQRQKRLIGRPQEALLCAKAKRQRQCFICAKAKRQQQSAQSERKSTPRYVNELF
ncbi:hypothetical protein FJQ98_03130 [Lysinibacillus agricola]|uniref:Uncharacterized protein n=1 Tax=Lysinibacillus agricola TaxID=2590012 RepID=A0ABX7AW33_9BACI|nr:MULTISPECIES: hypothetical protein [Lysinibacillus]QQP13083.1 hypothetical protein FJQ98_03130 [Lysinibacillus agricola]